MEDIFRLDNSITLHTHMQTIARRTDILLVVLKRGERFVALVNIKHCIAGSTV